MSFWDRIEARAASVARSLRRPAVYALVVAGIVLFGLAIRIALVPDADDILSGHIDGKQYFADAYSQHIHGFFEPFPHRANGWPLLLAGALRLFGFVGTSGFTMSMDAPFDQEAADAIVFSYAFHAVVAAALVPATLVLARQIAGPLTSAGAALLVAVDPFLLEQSTSVMADQIFAVLVVLALACVLRARHHPAWLAPAGALVALSHMARVNGLLILGTVVVLAAIYLSRVSTRHKRWHLLIPIVVFAIVAAPYLAWRAEYLPHAFDYGTNQRFWTDDPWDMDDAYWKSYSYSKGGTRETMSDYFATHTLGEAVERLYHSGQWQILDVTRVTLTPMLLLLGVAGMAASRKEDWSWMTPIVGLTLAGTFVWVYPIVRSPRYFMVLIPLFAILAAIGARHAAGTTRRATLAVSAIVATYLATYAVEPIVRIPRALVLFEDPHIAPMVGVAAVALALVVAAPPVLRDVKRSVFPLSARKRFA